jgi:hypothetical protein
MSAGSLTSHETLTGDLASFLDEVRVGSARGRLIFALDATASRKPTWDMAASLTAGMFREAATAGALDLQLVFYRSDKECQASGWMSDADRLVKMMAKIECEAGMTQIERILVHVQKETTSSHVAAMVFIDDACEENPDILVAKARELGELKTPCFMFQEGNDPPAHSTFRKIAKSTGGAYARFDAGAAKELGSLLRAVAIYATGGLKALESQHNNGATLLIDQLRRNS